MGKEIFGREREIQELEHHYRSGKAEFLAVYGRRRVGKTFLIRESFVDKGLYFALTGVKGASLRKQLKNFATEFTRVFPSKGKMAAPKTWLDAFNLLRKAIEKTKSKDRIILFFDELPWLATHRSGFLEDLDHFWNRYMSADDRVMCIVCGSAASWMIKKIVHHKGGLHGRLTGKIKLLPFDLQETEIFLRRQGVTLNRKGIVDIYMAIGGIPKYLSYVRNGKSSFQVVGDLCFNGPLVDEFHELYSSLFEHHERHIRVVQALAQHKDGLTKTQIALKAELSLGGGMNTVLEELEQSGFILSLRSFGREKKELQFRLIDEYSLFYLKWSDKAKENNLRVYDDAFWRTIASSSLGQAWAGYAFETICFRHLPQIKAALGIAGVLTEASTMTYKPKKGSLERGAQIDLLIDRADNCINLCEIKYCNEEFVINKSYDKILREKRAAFIARTKSKKSVFITLISPFGIKRGVGYFSIVDASLTLECLFGSGSL